MRIHRITIPALCLILLGSGHLLAQQRRGEQDSGEATLYETRGDIRAFSRRMDNAADDLELADAIVDLGSLYLRVVGDSRFPRSEILQANRGRLAMKLKQAERLVERSRQRAAGKRSEGPKSDSRYVVRSSAAPGDDGLESAVVDRQWQLAAHAVGGTGPAMYYASGWHGTSGHVYRGRHGGMLDDNGDELLDLIRTVIHPDFWNINGGPGRSYYYQPLRIIVLTATMRVHEDVTNLLERLR
jgi:hypothetical protein